MRDRKDARPNHGISKNAKLTYAKSNHAMSRNRTSEQRDIDECEMDNCEIEINFSLAFLTGIKFIMPHGHAVSILGAAAWIQNTRRLTAASTT